MAAKGGGAWKVAYADFATAMMAFFLVMWITSQNKAVKESIAQHFQNPLGTVSEARATSVHGIEGASADAPKVGTQAGPHGTDGLGIEAASAFHQDVDPTVRRPPDLYIFDRLDKTRHVGTIVLFGEESTEIDEEGERQLRALIPHLLGKHNKVELRGHSSTHPLSPDSPYKDEWEICYARCLSTSRFLMEHGIEKDRIRLSQDGSTEPYAEEYRHPTLHPLNSRVEVFAVSELTHRHKASVQERAGNFSKPPEETVEHAADGKKSPNASHEPAPKPATKPGAHH